MGLERTHQVLEKTEKRTRSIRNLEQKAEKTFGLFSIYAFSEEIDKMYRKKKEAENTLISRDSGRSF